MTASGIQFVLGCSPNEIYNNKDGERCEVVICDFSADSKSIEPKFWHSLYNYLSEGTKQEIKQQQKKNKNLNTTQFTEGWTNFVAQEINLEKSFYLLVDVGLLSNNQDHYKPLLIKFCPDTICVKRKMKLASSYDAVKANLPSFKQKEVTEVEELEYKKIVEYVTK